jgi:hypothetical protein
MCPPSRELPERSPSQVESTRKSKPCPANFTIEEDLTLVSSWLAISQDPVKSNEQKYEILWMKIHEYYHAHTTSETKRTNGSLQQRWSTIQLCTNKYSGCLAKIESLHQSGQYEAKFTELSRFAPHMIDTEEHKVDKFLDGLNFNIRERLTTANITEYKNLVHIAEWVERDVHELAG